MSLSDARIVLTDLFDKQIADSLVYVYTVRDSLNTSMVRLQKKEIDDLTKKCHNQELEITNYATVISNDDIIIAVKNDVIACQKKEIRKQKVLKLLGFTGCVVLPIVLLMFTHH